MWRSTLWLGEKGDGQLLLLEEEKEEEGGGERERESWELGVELLLRLGLAPTFLGLAFSRGERKICTEYQQTLI